MVTPADLARLQEILTEARAAKTIEESKALVAKHKPFIEQMTAEYIRKCGSLPPHMQQIARGFGIEF